MIIHVVSQLDKGPTRLLASLCGAPVEALYVLTLEKHRRAMPHLCTSCKAIAAVAEHSGHSVTAPVAEDSDHPPSLNIIRAHFAGRPGPSTPTRERGPH